MSIEQINLTPKVVDDSSTKGLTAKGNARRNFIIAGAAVGGGLLISFAMPKFLKTGGSEGTGTVAGGVTSDNAFIPNAFIKIGRDGKVTLVMHKVEMGQGTYTSIPMLIAEELEVDLNQVILEAAPANDKLYADPLLGSQVTGGSTSIRGAWKPLREAGATARVLLITTAAKQWNVDAATCHAEHGYVVNAEGKKLGYGELADAAATMPVPTQVTLKDPKDFKLIGTPAKRLDTPDKVNGKAQYGIDVRLPEMKIATVAACPVLGGKLASVDDSKALAVKGVHQVVKLENAVAVIADHMWAAKQGLAALVIQWDNGPNEKISSTDIIANLKNASENKDNKSQLVVARKDGDFNKAFKAATIQHESTYQVPFLSQAALEPMNCTVHVRKDGCDIWVGTQVPTVAQAGAMAITKLPAEKVVVHNYQIGGGFGRRLDADFIRQAVEIGMQVDTPVKVIWTREEDMQHGVYRPYYYDHLAAALDKDGNITAWNHRVTGSSVLARWAPAFFTNGLDGDSVEGAKEPLYVAPNMLVEYVRQEQPGLVTGWWRGVGPTHNTFMVETFIDELAEKVGKDPLAYRLSLLGHSPRAKAALTLAADKAGWGTPLPKGHGRGLSVQFAFGSYIAAVAELEIVDEEVKVKRVVAAVDCGMTVNPDTVVAQIQGGIIFGISGALFGEITTKDGRVEQSNFHNYRVVRMNEAPQIDVHLIASTEAPGGIGEPGTAVIAPALNNAVFAITGKRLRSLPIAPHLVKA